MKVCDVVVNSIWYDPRVRKQIKEYIKNGIDLCCVGFKCNRYDEEKIKTIPCEYTIASIEEKFAGKQNKIFSKIIREYLTNKSITDAIVKYNPDIIHANDLNALIPAYKAAKKLKCRIIYDSHEICTENFTGNKGFAQRTYLKFLNSIEKRICKKIDLMISVSNAAAEYFEKEFKINKPMVVTNCCFKDEQVQAVDKNNGFEILNHGQFYDGRGYDIMMESVPDLKEYPEIKLAIRGMGKLEQPLRSRAQELKADNFIFYPPVLIEELIEKASHSMVGVAITEPVCLNFRLSVSNKIFEYLAAGLPVIMSDIPEHRYLNEKYKVGIILKENTPQEFAKAAIKLYEDKEFYKACAQNAKRLSDDINWENEFVKLLEFEKRMI